VIVPLAVAGAAAIVTAALWASWSYRRMEDAALDARFAFRFRDPLPGPRAPRSDALGVRVGRSTLAEVKQLQARLKIECPDTSVRALMAQARAARQRDEEERKRRGLPPDAVSGASPPGGRRSLMERNPQVRLSCEGLSTSLLSDRTRAPSQGRLLFVFDSAEHPLRHVSFQRSIADEALARSEAAAAAADYQRVFGAPTRRPDPTAASTLPWLVPVEYEWSFTDLTVRVAALNFGSGKGIMFSEIVEVPVSIRPDAPAR
jgi:hypothetical protein